MYIYQRQYTIKTIKQIGTRATNIYHWVCFLILNDVTMFLELIMKYNTNTYYVMQGADLFPRALRLKRRAFRKHLVNVKLSMVLRTNENTNSTRRLRQLQGDGECLKNKLVAD